MKHAAIGLVVWLFVFALLMGILSLKGFDLSRIDQWPGLAALAAVWSGYFGSVAWFSSWNAAMTLGHSKEQHDNDR